MHRWFYNNIGVPKPCQACKSNDEKKYNWSNLSGKYSRDISDWVKLCRDCHMLFDFGSLRLVVNGKEFFRERKFGSVYRVKNKWQASACYKQKNYYAGRFTSKKEAILASLKLSRMLVKTVSIKNN